MHRPQRPRRPEGYAARVGNREHDRRTKSLVCRVSTPEPVCVSGQPVFSRRLVGEESGTEAFLWNESACLAVDCRDRADGQRVGHWRDQDLPVPSRHLRSNSSGVRPSHGPALVKSTVP